jgi:geranylgeranyl reductase
VWFLNPKLIGSGYGWIFPHQEFTSAGLFYDPQKINARQAKEKLDKILTNYGIDYSGSRFEGAPTNCLFNGFRFGNTFLLGDAAGLVSANTGEGISYALISGEDIARHILNNEYKFDKILEIIKYKKRQERTLKIFNIAYFSWIQTILFKIFIFLLNRPWFQRYYGD